MAGIATGVFKKLFVKKQTALGVKAPAGAAGSAKSMRRVSSTIDLSKANYQSAEIVESQQVRDSRHGVRSVGGTINGELSIGTYQQQLESIFRQPAQAAVSVGPLTNITAATDGAGTFTGTYTRGSGSFLTDGFKIGDVVKGSGWVTTGMNNNDLHVIIIDLTATVMSVRTLNKTDIAAKASGDSITIAQIGKKIFIPASGHTRDYYTIEHWFGDIGTEELFTDCVFTGANISLPPTGMATIELPVMGLDMSTDDEQYFTSPAAPSTGRSLAAVNGVLVINGEAVGLVTGFTVNFNGSYAYPSGDGIVGSNVRPDILPGIFIASGQMTVLFTDGKYRDMFINEEEASVAVVLTTDNSPSPGFMSIVLPRVKYSGSTKDDTNTGLTLTMPFNALEQLDDGGAGKPHLQTTASIQDSAYA